ncbi:uncharacterized protein MICPUCDRAFT_48890 [Micromonas pusilla CCMP1545]|uniref:Predicted protein n=1 Tax=Micromonas pusilla (strain CCMP1545) TaxID=564608 RepID=C1N5E2_MICPC|nr:uncharacterized protein MICPUCDRAFT_48890 [Micromonas pusilla CCMP1545]EEH52677.1 predicted protein [Micromonas pusilla CCMP1545]|eukprot:XP_003063541.1 predicted protein [Micromonas pusilla CCMP1545]
MPAPPPVAASSSSLLLSRVLALDPIALLACALFLMGVYFALVLAAGSSPLARIVLFKTSLFARSVRHLALSREKSGWPKTRPDPDVVVADVALSPPREKRVIFVRHGESTWNEVFNRGFGPGFPLRLAWGLLHEAAVIFSRGSFFVDAPLSHRGYRQARELRAFLKTYEPTGDGTTTNPDAAALRGDVRSILVGSNLRRAVATIAIGFWDRIARTREKIIVHSALQEMARNVDAYAIARRGEAVPLDGVEAKIGGGETMDQIPSCDARNNEGNKKVDRCGNDALLEFAAWVVENTKDADCVIVGGHSLWFKEFFKAFLPRRSDHVAKKKKIVNCGCVGFTLQAGRDDDGRVAYRIDPKSVDVIYGGFAK